MLTPNEKREHYAKECRKLRYRLLRLFDDIGNTYSDYEAHETMRQLATAADAAHLAAHWITPDEH